jgi:hypothetical protein
MALVRLAWSSPRADNWLQVSAQAVAAPAAAAAATKPHRITFHLSLDSIGLGLSTCSTPAVAADFVRTALTLNITIPSVFSSLRKKFSIPGLRRGSTG